jgi:hypothetical protein
MIFQHQKNVYGITAHLDIEKSPSVTKEGDFLWNEFFVLPLLHKIGKEIIKN